MRKKVSFWTITAVLMLFTFLALPMGVSAADFPYGINATGQYPFDGGDGTKNDPFLISTPQQLAQLAYDVAQEICYQDQYLKLTADLDLNGLDWLPIGASATEEFMGHFDGNNKTISNLSIGSSATPCNLEEVGLFGYVSYAHIHNLKIENAAVYSAIPDYYGEIGVLAGEVNDTDFSFCSVSGTLSSSSRSGSCVGGLIGSIDYTEKHRIIGCSAAVDITVSSEYDGDVGGLIGENNASVIACSASGNISGKGYLGGLAGENNGNIIDCFATGNIISSTIAGGLVGDNEGDIYNSYATGTVSGYDYSGGLVGYHSYYALIANSDATGNVSAGSGSREAGGLVGSCSGSMINSYAAGQVTNGQGLTDYLYAGGTYDPATAVNCFWNSTLNITGGAGIGKTTLEMQNPNFLLLLNDPALEGRKPIFRDWIIVSGVNNDMPVLDGVGPMNTAKPVISAASAAHHLAAAAEISFDSDMLGEFYYAVVASGADAPDIDTGGSGSLCYEGENEYTIPAVTGAWDIYIVIKGLNGKESNPVKIELSAEPALFAGGTGTKNDPYQIATAYHLHNVRDFPADYFILNQDIDLDPALLYDTFWYDAANGWRPISDSSTLASTFQGHFDGNGKTISNLTIGSADHYMSQYTYAGLFGAAGSNAVIFDVNLDGLRIYSSNTAAGGIAAVSRGMINHCSVTGTIIMNSGAPCGGVAGGAEGVASGAETDAEIRNCWTNVELRVNNGYAGGIAGYNFGVIANSAATGDVLNGQNSYTGGLVGYNGFSTDSPNIINCYAAGNIRGTGWGYIGPFYGNKDLVSSFADCYYNSDAVITAVSDGYSTPTLNMDTNGLTAKTAADLKTSGFTALLNGKLPDAANDYCWIIKSEINKGYPVLQDALADVTPPAIGNKTISASGITENSVTLSWAAATDNVTAAENLVYRLYRSSSDNIGTVAKIEANGTPVTNFGSINSPTAENLTAATTYYFNVLVKDEAGNKTVYETKCITTAAPPVHLCPSEKFTDVNTSLWYHEGIDFVLQAGLFVGTSETKFSPDADMTRAMLVTVLWRLEKEPSSNATNPFTDVPGGTWYTEAVIWAAEIGVVKGYDQDTFGSKDPVTREQMATILYRYATIKGYDVSTSASLNQFTDAGKVSSWATGAVKWAVAAGLIQGVKATALDAGGKASRAQVATILMRFMKPIDK